MNHHIARWHSLTLSPADRAILDQMEEEMRWHPLNTTTPPADTEILVLNIETGDVAISSTGDKPHRRGIYHRNGFPATHWHEIIPEIPAIDPHYRLRLSMEGGLSSDDKAALHMILGLHE